MVLALAKGEAPIGAGVPYRMFHEMGSADQAHSGLFDTMEGVLEIGICQISGSRPTSTPSGNRESCAEFSTIARIDCRRKGWQKAEPE
jgi:hypothetical protein